MKSRIYRTQQQQKWGLPAISSEWLRELSDHNRVHHFVFALPYLWVYTLTLRSHRHRHAPRLHTDTTERQGFELGPSSCALLEALRGCFVVRQRGTYRA